MSIPDIVSLDDHRGRRDARFRQTLALYGADDERRRLVSLLREAIRSARADRAGILWIDEYGGGLVHTHCVLDLSSDRPRRTFALEPLRRAWEEGIPGLLDEPNLQDAGSRVLPDGPRSFCSIALGSDGVRAWFLSVDSRAARNRLEQEAVESLMFTAGECASVLLRPGMARGGDPIGSDEGDESLPFERLRTERFSGWPVLQDTDGSETDPDRGQVITIRFLISRLLDGLVEEDFAVDRQSLLYQVEGIRSEVRQVPVADRTCWERVLEAAVSGDHAELARAALELANDAENQGHLHGARELNRLAYDIAVVAGDPEAAMDAARFLGRVCRRMGAWKDSERWYEVGRDVARSGGFRRQEALVLDGLGNTVRVRGNLPKARRIYRRVLEIGSAVEDRYACGSAHQNLMLVEKHAGRTDKALYHGWEAVQAYTSDLHVFAALADLGDIFLQSGELSCAESAFEIVSRQVQNLDIRCIAFDALAHISALRGNRGEFQRRTAQLTEGQFAKVSVEVRAEIHLYRGKSYLALKEREMAEMWIRRSLELAERHGVSRILFEAEGLLDSLQEGSDVTAPCDRGLPKPTSRTISDLQGPLRDLQNQGLSGLSL